MSRRMAAVRSFQALGIALALMPLLVLGGAVVAQVTTQPPSTIQPTVITGLSQVPTYSGAVVSLANTGGSDIYCVTGSDTKLVKITGFSVSPHADGSGIVAVTVVLRSTLNTGGGLASVPIVKMDQLNPAPTAVVNSFTSAPTYGTAIGTIRSIIISMEGTGATGRAGIAPTEFPFTWGQPIVLRGSTQEACIHSESIGAGGHWEINHDHTEE